MHKMDELMDMLCDKLDEYVEQRKLNTTSELDSINKLTDSIKNVLKIEMLDEAASYGENDYSRRYSNRGASYARKRDSMGRYSRDYRDGRESYRRGYSRDDAKEQMIDQIEDMMQDASTEKEREALRKCMNALQNV